MLAIAMLVCTDAARSARSTEERELDIPSSSALTWNRLPDLPDELGVAGPFVGVNNDALIVAGGANFPKPVWETSKVWLDRIHVLTKNGQHYEWKGGGTLSRPLAYGAAVTTTDGVLCMGGNDSTDTFREVFLLNWDQPKQQVTRIDYPPLPRPCAFGQATLIGDVVYLAGGQSGNSLDTAMRNFWTLDLSQRRDEASFKWKELSAWPGSSRALNITVHQHNGTHNAVYVLSGRREEDGQVEFLRDVWEFTPKLNSWRRRADLPRSVMAGTGIGFGKSQILVLGGADGSLFTKADELKDAHPGFPKEALSYNTVDDHWNSAGPMPRNHVTTIPVLWDDRIIIASGEIRPRVRSAAIWSISR